MHSITPDKECIIHKQTKTHLLSSQISKSYTINTKYFFNKQNSQIRKITMLIIFPHLYLFLKRGKSGVKSKTKIDKIL